MSSSNTILIVDDTPANLQVACETLNDAGYEVITAIDGDRALKRIQIYPPDLILLDVQMPGIDGFEVCRRLKADSATAQIPVIFMTAINDTDSKVQGFELGAVDYITKPFQSQELLARIKTHLQLSQLTKTLEQTVAERAAALAQLQQTQVQMVQNEKMSALGQMVAGIAHEINNPVSFIYGNIDHLKRYTDDLLCIVQTYQQHYPDPPQSLQNLIKSIDLDFLVEDIQKLLKSTKIGSERIMSIVISLRNFSRLDEADLKPVNVHEGIESTLVILQNRLRETVNRSEICIIRDYDDLPLVICYSGQLNQVFMNLLSNAIDAIEELNQSTSHQVLDYSGHIKIRTEVINVDYIKITIADNGIGMTEEVRSRLFDPFFTTKPIGAGTGLGLSISHQITVKKHNGQLYCDSAPGEGSKFCIEIPVWQSEKT